MSRSSVNSPGVCTGRFGRSLFALFLSATLLVGCGGASTESTTTPPPAETPPQDAPEPTAPANPPARRYEDCPAIACGGCQGGYATELDGCPSCRCLFEAPSVQVSPAP